MVSPRNKAVGHGAAKPRNAVSYKPITLLLAAAIIIIAGLLRFVSTADRPVHTDEAVNAFILAELLEKGNYVYDRHEYHGPSLYYLSLPAAWIRSQSSLTALDETTLRAVPAIAGMLIILLILWLAKPLGWRFVIIATSILAVAPPMVYYSRYYIHEMMLVGFNLGFILGMYRYFLSKNMAWIIVSGVFAGLMAATKETWVLIGFAQCVAGAVTVFWFAYKGSKHPKDQWQSIFRNLQESIRNERKSMNPRHLAFFFLSACFVALALFSSLMKNPAGVPDAVKAYADYFHRAGLDTAHIHPWYYYFKLLITNECSRFPFRADAWVLLLGIAGFVHVMLSKSRHNLSLPFFIFVAIYGMLTAIIFSTIPYKTPWNLLPFWLPAAIMAAYFIEQLAVYFIRLRILPWLFLLTAIPLSHLTYQTWKDNFSQGHEPCNPFTYAHPTKEIFLLTEEIQQLAKTVPEGRKLFIEVIVPDNEYWPLPWYLRHFNSVGWFGAVDMSIPAAPLVVCATELSSELAVKLFEVPPPGKRHLYIPLLEYDPEIRPGMPVTLLLRKDYYDRYMAGKAEARQSGPEKFPQ